MWISNKEDIAVNLHWVEAFQEELEGAQAVLFFPWGNDPLRVSGKQFISDIKSHLWNNSLTRPHAVRVFHSFKYDFANVLIDLQEIKVVKKTPNCIHFYRRYHEKLDQNEGTSETQGYLLCADNAEWDSLLSEIERHLSD